MITINTNNSRMHNIVLLWFCIYWQSGFKWGRQLGQLKKKQYCNRICVMHVPGNTQNNVPPRLSP